MQKNGRQQQIYSDNNLNGDSGNFPLSRISTLPEGTRPVSQVDTKLNSNTARNSSHNLKWHIKQSKKI